MPIPLWRIEIVKELAGEQWSNDYLTSDLTMDDAQDLAAVLQTWERNIHMTVVSFTYIRVSSYTPGDRTFRHLTTNLPGLREYSDYMPLYNTMRIDFGTSDSDPGRKYYRCPVAEAWSVNGAFVGEIVTLIASNINTFLVATDALEHLVTPKGNQVTAATLYPKVQMRQLHRRRKKKVTP